MANTGIEYGTTAWNPVTGCTKISEACQNCWAERMSKRLAGRHGYEKDNPFKVTLHPDRLDQPLRWRKPRTVLVSFMGDLFHEDVPDDFIGKVFNTMANAQWVFGHKFLILTKRPVRMKRVIEALEANILEQRKPIKNPDGTQTMRVTFALPLQNIWLGVTAENQQRADERIPILLQTPAAKRFVSVEPMLGPVDLNHLQPNREVEIDCLKGTHGVIRPHSGTNTKLDWVICGGESGPGARPLHPDWVRSLRDQCVTAGVPFFFKQWGEWYPDKKGIYHAPFLLFGNTVIHRVGKKKAGRLLDGQEWQQMPEKST